MGARPSGNGFVEGAARAAVGNYLAKNHARLPDLAGVADGVGGVFGRGDSAERAEHETERERGAVAARVQNFVLVAANAQKQADFA